MPMRLAALDEALVDGALEFPFGGKIYRTPPISAATALEVQRMNNALEAIASASQRAQQAARDVDEDADATERIKEVTRGVTISEDDQDLIDEWGDDDVMQVRLLGSAYDEMLEDEVPWVVIQRATQVAWLYITQGDEAATARWQGGNEGKALAVPGKKAQRTRTASRSGSSRARASKRSQTARAGRGQTSSSSGAPSSSTSPPQE